jgi:hypothetical protein
MELTKSSKRSDIPPSAISIPARINNGSAKRAKPLAKLKPWVARYEISLPVVKANNNAPKPKAKATGVSINNKITMANMHKRKIVIVC